MAHEMSWLDALAGSLRCPGCGEAYLRQDLQVVGERDAYLFVRCECRRCGRDGIVVATVEIATVRMPLVPRGRRPAITEDDVLSAHEILRDHRGGLSGLFDEQVRRPR